MALFLRFDLVSDAFGFSDEVFEYEGEYEVVGEVIEDVLSLVWLLSVGLVCYVPERSVMRFLVLVIIMVLCACSPKPKVEDVGVSEASFLSLHYKILYDFFGGHGFDKANLNPHSHHLMVVQEMQKIFLSDGVDLASVLFVDCTDEEKIKISKFPTHEDLDDQTRKLNDAERKALEGLLSKKVGYAGYREKDSGMNSFMWPIRAMNETCVACHGVEKGELLGAIVYQFPERAED